MHWGRLVCVVMLLVNGVGPRALAKGSPHTVVPVRKTMCLQPLGPFDKRLVGPILAGVKFVFGFRVRVLAARQLPKEAYYAPRKRYRSTRLLDYLDKHVVPKSGCDWVIGFTKVDISTTKGNIKDWGVLGEARLGGTSGMVSSYRMRRGVNRTTLKKRAVKVVVHELGHALGVPHYNQPGCVMNDARGTVKTVDTESGELCEFSRKIIEKRHSVSLPVRRALDWSMILGQ